MADASKIIERLSVQVATLTRDNAILSVELDEMREARDCACECSPTDCEEC